MNQNLIKIVAKGGISLSLTCYGPSDHPPTPSPAHHRGRTVSSQSSNYYRGILYMHNIHSPHSHFLSLSEKARRLIRYSQIKEKVGRGGVVVFLFSCSLHLQPHLTFHISCEETHSCKLCIDPEPLGSELNLYL